VSEFSILEKQILERERKLIEDAAYGKGPHALPADWEKSRKERLKLAGRKTPEGFFYFAKTYFPQWFEYEFSDLHRQMIEAALKRDRRIHIFAAQRDGGKTRIFRVFKAWVACFGIYHHYSKASDTIDLVLKDFRWVRDILKYNPKIKSDFGEIVDAAWDSQHSFRVKPHKYNKTGTLFNANSMTVTPRGELGETRMDFIEFDDFEDFSTSINPDISKNKIDIIERDFHPALIEKGCGIYLGNNARTTCLINILAEMPEAERKIHHPAFTLTIVPAWDEDAKRAMWYQRFDFDSEEEMRTALNVSMSVWLAEYQQKPQPPEGVRFLLKHWNTFVFEKEPQTNTKSTVVSKRGLIGVMFCDPSLGTASDFKAGVVMLYSPALKKFLIPECFCRRAEFEEYFHWMYQAYNRWRSHVFFIGWESNFRQEKYLEFKNAYASTRDLPDLPIRAIEVEGNKFFRIETQLEMPYSMGNILFHENFVKSYDGIQAQAQLIGYEGKKDATHKVDFLDCAASAYKELFPYALRASAKSTESRIVVGGRSAYADW